MKNKEIIEVDARDARAKALGATISIKFDDDKVIYLKKPHRMILGIALSKMEVNPLEAKEIILNNCVIKEVSDFELLQNDEYFLSAVEHVDELLVIKKSFCQTL